VNPLTRWRERRRAERELDDEMAAHILERTEQLIEQGQSPQDAARNARLQFGNIGAHREESGDAWGWTGVVEFAKDLRFGCRLLARSPGFTATAVLTLALAIGSATAVFTIVDSVLLRPLAFKDSGELVVAWERLPAMSAEPVGPNARHVDFWKQRTTAFSGWALVHEGTRGVALGSESPFIVGTVSADPGLFDLIGVNPSMGRAFTPEEGVTGRDHVVVLTHEFWQNRLHGDPGVLGRQIRIADSPFEVIGVLPRDFRFPNANALKAFNRKQGAGVVPEPEIFMPVVVDLAHRDWGGDFGNQIALARLRPGLSLRQAEAQIVALQPEIGRNMGIGEPSKFPQVSLQPMQEAVVGGSQRALWFLMAAVSALLLTACLNLAGAQLSRSILRRREAAVRSALGASRWRLLRGALAESLVLAVSGGAVGILLAVAGLEAFRRYSAVDIPRLSEVGLNFTVLAFSLAITAGATLVFGLLPALRMMGVDPQSALQNNTRSVMGSRHGSRASAWLVGLEVAGCAALLMITALFAKSLANVMSQDRGFETGHVAIAQVDLSHVFHSEAKQRIAADDQMLSALRQIPGVESAGLVSAMPLEGESWIEYVQREDRPQQQNPLVNLRWISSGYFETVRQRIVAGRSIEERDREQHGAVLSEAFAKEVWPGENPLGAQVQIEGRKFTVVGVVADARSTSLKTSPPAVAYVHYSDRPPFATFFMVRGPQPAPVSIASLRHTIRSALPEATLNRVKTLDEQLTDSIATDRLQTALLAAFGFAALALAMLGIYGVLSCSVAGRRQEIGVRIALGATRGAIYGSTLREALIPVAGGLVCGLAAGVLSFRVVRSLLYGIETVEPSTVAIVPALFIAAALAAGFVPARRAASVDPMEALRTD
jgi:predicted permease